jgi:hypothetical protein
VNYQNEDLHVSFQMTVKQLINSRWSSAMASVKPGQTWSNLVKLSQTHQNPSILETWSWIDGFPYVWLFSAGSFVNRAASVCTSDSQENPLGKNGVMTLFLITQRDQRMLHLQISFLTQN